ncbi:MULTISPECIES: HNH endonuclease [unclassified Streptomyces]|uniref:HNH endonuclease signature motif containing protein n=1 Tax=unclassified Streptomyces TaxID=2593676 RepID=UPI002E11E4AD|nr:HNH endonuclease [Streptomyces sp. NBC_01197]WSS49436.1 HNH endonuclease [Streptomyces sp. NBC_01180]
MSTSRYSRDLLARTAAVSTGLVDLMRRLGSPMDARTLRYLRVRLEYYGIGTPHFTDEPLPARERRSYSRQLLEDAAAHSYSIREMMEYLGYPPSDSPYGLISTKLERYGIDTSHFRSGRKHGPPVLPREPLATVVAQSVSLAGVLRGLGQENSGAARTRVSRSLAAHEISTEHFTGQGHARGTVSPFRGSADEILRQQAPGSPRTKTVKLRRALDDLDVPHICAECGIGDIWQGRRLVLEIDHTNGDRLDNRRENLRYLCPSCHSQTVTFANRSASLRGTK